MQYPIWALIIGSILSSVALVLVNKEVFRLGFPYPFSLSTLHFVVTWGLLQVMSGALGLFERKFLPWRTNIVVGALGVASISLMNFSLQYNSVGLYQVSKLCIVPCVLVINALNPSSSSAETTSRKVKGSLVLVLFGVGIATVTDVQLNRVGLVFAVLAVLSTSQYQIWQGAKQREAGITGMQCAQSVAFVQIFFGLLLSAAFESTNVAKTMAESSVGGSTLLTMILVSCLLAVSVNVHSFALIGKTSAVTWQVVGHGKTCLILVFGYMFYPIVDPVQLLKNVAGVAIALTGVILYGHLKLKEGSEHGDWCDLCLPQSFVQQYCSVEPAADASGVAYSRVDNAANADADAGSDAATEQLELGPAKAKESSANEGTRAEMIVEMKSVKA